MDHDHRQVISQHGDLLETDLNLHGLLLEKLQSKGVIDEETKQEISHPHKTQISANRCFLESLKLGTQSNFEVFLQLLRNDGQQHIANLLDKTPGDRPLSDRTKERLRERAGDLSDIMDVGSEIVLYLFSKKAISIIDKQRIEAESVEYKKFLELLKVILRSSDKTLTLLAEALINTNQMHVADLLKDIVAIPESDLISGVIANSTMMQHLPMEMLEMILLKAYLMAVKKPHQKQRTGTTEREIIHKLSYVSYIFMTTMHRQKFKSSLNRKLRVVYRSAISMSSKIHNNRAYLVRHLHLRGILDRFHAAGLLTDEQIRLTKIHVEQINQNEMFLDALLQSFSSGFFEMLLYQLRRTEQHLVADVLETGGVVVKVIIRSCLGNSQKAVKEQLIEKLNDLRRKRTPMKDQLEQLLLNLKKQDIEILNGSCDDQMEIWFWCLSQNGLSNLQDLAKDESKLIDLLSTLFRHLQVMGDNPQEFIVPETVFVDMDQFTKQIVESGHELALEHRIDFGKRRLYGVTVLGSAIYVLCNSPISIIVYQSQHPFNKLREMNFAVFNSPNDIAACRISNCLYVPDFGRLCVWKVAADNGVASLWLSDQDWPFTVSVNERGEVLLSRNGIPCRLESFGQDAESVYKLRLPPEFLRVWHAVETARGNFVISYIRKYKFVETDSVCELNREGQMLRMYHPKSDSDMLNYPWHIALDMAERSLLVDTFNNRVILFDVQFRAARVLITKDKKNRTRELVYPQRLCSVKDEMRVMVVHGGGKDDKNNKDDKDDKDDKHGKLSIFILKLDDLPLICHGSSNKK